MSIDVYIKRVLIYNVYTVYKCYIVLYRSIQIYYRAIIGPYRKVFFPDVANLLQDLKRTMTLIVKFLYKIFSYNISCLEPDLIIFLVLDGFSFSSIIELFYSFYLFLDFIYIFSKLLGRLTLNFSIKVKSFKKIIIIVNKK